MKAGEASHTAELNALFRAIESNRWPRCRRRFEDRLAPGFLGGRARRYYILSRVPLLGALVPWYIDRGWPGVRTSALGRTCWIDEQLRTALSAETQQVVILGAGYDCRAYRVPGIERIRVFELDHPQTLAVKRRRVAEMMGGLPGHVAYVEIDFSTQALAAVLDAAGFDRGSPSFFLWEGVIHYLTADAVEATLREIASLAAPQSRLVFTYVHSGVLDGSATFGDLGQVPSTLKEAGESWTFGFRPEELPAYLAEHGFALRADVDSTRYRAQYLGPSARNLRGFAFYRAVLAVRAC